ncbi:unnamed protein product, partial [Iphiclides podalirius]
MLIIEKHPNGCGGPGLSTLLNFSHLRQHPPVFSIVYHPGPIPVLEMHTKGSSSSFYSLPARPTLLNCS